MQLIALLQRGKLALSICGAEFCGSWQQGTGYDVLVVADSMATNESMLSQLLLSPSSIAEKLCRKRYYKALIFLVIA